MPLPFRTAFVCVLATLGLLLAGCGTTVVRPPADLADPVGVFIADYGKHSSLVLTRDDAGLVEWAYGEWRWFAEGKNGFWRIPGVLLGSNPGALGRRDLGPLPPEPEELTAGMGLESASRVEVDRTRAAELLAKLEGAYAAGAAPPTRSLFNPENGLTFVPDARPYSMDFHCNTVVAQWLRELGCEVSDASFVTDFRVETAIKRIPGATPGGSGQ